jgi:hypothetical protein
MPPAYFETLCEPGYHIHCRMPPPAFGVIRQAKVHTAEGISWEDMHSHRKPSSRARPQRDDRYTVETAGHTTDKIGAYAQEEAVGAVHSCR